MKLYLDPQSSSCLRVLSALAFKGVALEQSALDLRAGDQFREPFVQRNPGGLLPVLEMDDGSLLTQSMAIIEWLEVRFPQPSAVPVDVVQRARMRELCSLVASDWHVMASLRLRKALTARLGATSAQTQTWGVEWTLEGLRTVERALRHSAGSFCVGDQVSMADFFVAPALLNVERSRLGLTDFPLAARVYASCLSHPAFVGVLNQRTALNA